MSKPTVEELQIKLKDLIWNWESFALKLPGIEESDLQEIKYNKRNDDVKSQKIALYSKWLKVYPNASWDDVTKALQSPVVKENTIAKDLQIWISSNDRQMSLSPKQPQAESTATTIPTEHLGLSNDQSHQEVYNVPERIVDKLKELHNSFVPLAKQTKDEIKVSQVKVESLVSYVEEQRAFPTESNSIPISNTEGFFQSIKPHYNFLNPYLLVALAIQFLTGEIVQNLQRYNDKVTTFSKTTSVKSLVKTLTRFRDNLRSTTNNKIIKIRVKHGLDHRLTIWVVQMLVETLFPVMYHSELPWFEVGVGSLVLSFIATNHMILPLIVSCARKMEFMRHLGIISVTIGNILIRVDNEETEDDEFSFEDSLIQATASDHIEAVQFLLKYTRVNVNATHTKNSFLRFQRRFYHEQLQYMTKDKTLEILHFLVRTFKIIRDKILEHLTSTEDSNIGPDDKPPNISKLLQEIEYHVLNTELLKNQLSHLPDPIIQQMLITAYDLSDSLKSEAKIVHLQEFLQFSPALNYTTQVTIILSKVWSECSVQGIQEIVRFLFRHTPIDEFYWFRVKELKKTLKIKLLLTPKQERLPFDHLRAKVFGVIEVRLNNSTVFMSKESKDSYTFEKGIKAAKGLDKTTELVFVPFLKHAIEFPCTLFRKDALKPDSNNNFQMIPEYKSTPLVIACCNSNGQIVQLLLEHGADPNIKAIGDFETALFYCTTSSKIFQMLLNRHGADIPVIPENNANVLQNACIINNVKVVDMLLKNKYPHINTKDKAGHTPLLRACAQGYTDIVELLLKAKADPSIPTDASGTPLSAASANGHLPVVETLLKAKMDPNILDAEGKTSLWGASYEGHEAVVKCLLMAQANPDICDNDGVTPLGAASCKGHEAVVECLLHAQADPSIPDINDRTPLRIACENGHTRTASILFNHMIANCKTDKDRSAWIATAKRQLSVELVEILLDAQEDPSILEM